MWSSVHHMHWSPAHCEAVSALPGGTSLIRTTFCTRVSSSPVGPAGCGDTDSTSSPLSAAGHRTSKSYGHGDVFYFANSTASVITADWSKRS